MAHTWLVVSLLLLFAIPNGRGFGRRSMTIETYHVIVALLKGTYNVPVRDRTKVEKAAIIRYWRNREHFSLAEDGETLLLNGKEVVAACNIRKIVDRGLAAASGAGARTANTVFPSVFSGMNRTRVQKVLYESRNCQPPEANYSNNTAIQRSVDEIKVQSRHRVDLLDLSEWAVEYEGLACRYVLVLVDALSGYIWLRALKENDQSVIAEHLTSIYLEHGPPRTIHLGQGPELSGTLEQLRKRFPVQVLTSSPDNIHSQREVEGTHRELRQRTTRELISLKKLGVNWAEKLPLFAANMNEEPREELGWKSPFELYYGRNKNRAVNSSQTREDEVKTEMLEANEVLQPPRKGMVECEQIDDMAEPGIQGSCFGGGMYDPDSVFERKEVVLVRMRVGKRSQIFVEGQVKKRNLAFQRYKVKLTPPGYTEPIRKWFPVSDITSAADLEPERAHRDDKSLDHYKMYYIAHSHEDLLKSLQAQGLSVIYDPQPDGNCQFSALADQLGNIGIHRTAIGLRHEIVNSLRVDPTTLDGELLEDYVQGNDFCTYLENMNRNGTHGDHITLQRAAQVYGVRIVVFSSLGRHATNILSPPGSTGRALPIITLGHVAEDEGEHYLSVQASDGALNGLGLSETSTTRLHNQDDQSCQSLRSNKLSG